MFTTTALVHTRCLLDDRDGEPWADAAMDSFYADYYEAE